MSESQKPHSVEAAPLPPVPRLQPGQLLPPDLEIQALLGCHGGTNLYRAMSGPFHVTLLEVSDTGAELLLDDERLESLLPELPSVFRLDGRAYALFRGTGHLSLKETVLNCEEGFLGDFLFRLINAAISLHRIGIDVTNLGPQDVVLEKGEPVFLVFPAEAADSGELAPFVKRLVSHVLFCTVLPKTTRSLKAPIQCLSLSGEFEAVLNTYLESSEVEPLFGFLQARYEEPVAYWDCLGQTHSGIVRDHNEDAFAWNMKQVHSYQRSLQACFLAVSDGMGGHQNGEQASHLSLETFMETLDSQLTGDFPPSNPGLGALVLAGFQRAGEVVREAFKAFNSRTKPGATMVAGLVHGRQLFLGNCGDSRAYLFSQNQLTQLSVDHSLNQLYLQRGLISRAESEENENHVITSFIGIEEKSFQRDLYVVHLPVGGKLLLCSDGLTDMVKNPELAQILGESTTCLEANQRLMMAALANGGHDNITLLTLFDRNQEVLPELSAQEPVSEPTEPGETEESYEQ